MARFRKWYFFIIRKIVPPMVIPAPFFRLAMTGIIGRNCQNLIVMKLIPVIISFTQARYFLRSSPMNFSSFLMSTDYIFSLPRKGLSTSARLCVLPKGIVVEDSPVRSFPADYPLPKYLGFNLISSDRFFLLSPPSHLAFSCLCCGPAGFRAFQHFRQF